MEAAAAPDRPAPVAVPSGPVALRKRRAWGSGLLLAGVAALAAIDLVFAFAPGGWTLLLRLGGMLLVLVGWLMLAVLGWRYALAATLAVVIGYHAIPAVAPYSQRLSWRMLLWTHGDSMERAVALLEPVPTTELRRRRDPVCTHPGLPPASCAPLQAALKDFGAHAAWKEGEITIFMTRSWINRHAGILHCPRECTEPAFERDQDHVTGRWYRWGD